MEYKDLIFEKDGPIAVVTLNRPNKLNALSKEMRSGLPLIIQEVENDNNIHAMIITGAGRGFCSGADVSVQADKADGKITAKTRNDYMGLVGDILLSFENIDKPVIAAINGITTGIGLTLALACDVRIASESARFSAIWVKRGLIPDGGATYLLPMVVGMDKALELAYTGNIIDSEEAERINLVTRVVPDEELMSRAKELALQISKMPPITIGMIKKIMWEDVRRNLKKSLYYEGYAQMVCHTTQDQKEAVKSFMEKREPRFRGL